MVGVSLYVKVTNTYPLAKSRQIPPIPICLLTHGERSAGANSKKFSAKMWTDLSFVTTLTAPPSSVTKYSGSLGADPGSGTVAIAVGNVYPLE